MLLTVSLVSFRHRFYASADAVLAVSVEPLPAVACVLHTSNNRGLGFLGTSISLFTLGLSESKNISEIEFTGLYTI